MCLSGRLMFHGATVYCYVGDIASTTVVDKFS